MIAPKPKNKTKKYKETTRKVRGKKKIKKKTRNNLKPQDKPRKGKRRKIQSRKKKNKSYIRHEDFRPSSVTLVQPPLKSETGWTGELWWKTNLLNWQDEGG